VLLMLSLFWLIVDTVESGFSFCLAHSYEQLATVAYKVLHLQGLSMSPASRLF
jgi:hypothetical protein